jgi:DNA-binding transcriptional ArsR family regulator
MIEKIFGSRIRAKILGWFFTHPEESFFVRQIATILQEDPTNLSREMSKLENLGILTSKKIGNTKHFQANPHCAFFRELKGLVGKCHDIVYPELKVICQDIVNPG